MLSICATSPDATTAEHAIDFPIAITLASNTDVFVIEMLVAPAGAGTARKAVVMLQPGPQYPTWHTQVPLLLQYPLPLQVVFKLWSKI